MSRSQWLNVVRVDRRRDRAHRHVQRRQLLASDRQHGPVGNWISRWRTAIVCVLFDECRSVVGTVSAKYVDSSFVVDFDFDFLF